MGFDRNARRTKAETELIEAIENGERYWPDDPANTTISAKLIECILRGIPMRGPFALSRPADSAPRAVRVGASGIYVSPSEPYLPAGEVDDLTWRGRHRLRLEDKLDLKSVRCVDAGGAPTIRLRYCCFDQRIDMSDGRFGSLSLEGSFFEEFKADWAHFDGGVHLKWCGPSEDGGQCRVRMEYARIDGVFDLSNGFFAAPSSEEKCSNGSREGEAIDLDWTKIEGSLRILRADITGKLTARSCRIIHNFWFCSSKIATSPDQTAINLQYAQIGSLIGFKRANSAPPGEACQAGRELNEVIGRISGMGVTAGEIWIGGGVFAATRPEESNRAVYDRAPEPEDYHAGTIEFPKANIRRSLTIGGYRISDTKQSCAVVGEIILTAADIGKNFEVHHVNRFDAEKGHGNDGTNAAGRNGSAGRTETLEQARDRLLLEANPKKRSEYFQLSAHALVVGRRGEISNTCLSAPPNPSNPYSRNGALDLWKSRFGTGFRMFHGTCCDGPIFLNRSTIGRDAVISVRKAEAREPGEEFKKETDTQTAALDLSGAKIEGDLRIAPPKDEHSVFEGPVLLPGCTIEGNVRLERVALRCSKLDSEEQRKNSGDAEHASWLDLRGLCCDAELHIRDLRYAANDPAPVLDCRRLKCAALDDQDGVGWGMAARSDSRSNEPEVILRAAGIHIDQIVRDADDKPSVQRAKDRLAWLEQQRKDEDPGQIDFVAQTHNVFAKAHSNSGENDIAREILIAKRKLETRTKYARHKEQNRRFWRRD